MRKFILSLGLFVTPAVHGQSLPVIRAKLVPPSGVIVGQPVRLEVVVLVPNYFTGAPVYPPFEMDGAIVTLSDDRPEHLNEQINGTTYAGIRRFYLIYPEQPSDFHLPPVDIAVAYVAAPPATTAATLRLPPLHFRAKLPPAARDLDYFLPTSRLTMQQKWSVPLNNLHVGDSVSRTIVVTTENMQAMLIPPLPLKAPDGVRIYPKGPSVEDEKSVSGVFRQGVRTERASYLFAKAGDYVLPEIEITWWNLTTQKLATSKLPETKFRVGAAAYVSELPPEQEPPTAAQTPQRNWRQYLSLLWKLAVVFGLAALLFWVIRRWGPRLALRYRALASHRRNSEAAYWYRFKQACYRNDATQSYVLLLAWLRRSDRAITLDEFQRQVADPRLDQQIAILSQTLFRAPAAGGWNGPTLYRAVTSHRRNARSTNQSATHLPALNPEP